MGKTLKTAIWLLTIVLVPTSLVLCQHSPATIPAPSNPLGQSPEGEGDLQKATQNPVANLISVPFKTIQISTLDLLAGKETHSTSSPLFLFR
jgi:hypothetical protein